MDKRRIHAGRLRAAGYDASGQRLEIEFDDGSIKTFRSVPGEVWRRLIAAPNPAVFYADRIEEEYPFDAGRASGSTDVRAKLDSLFGSGPAGR